MSRTAIFRGLLFFALLFLAISALASLISSVGAFGTTAGGISIGNTDDALAELDARVSALETAYIGNLAADCLNEGMLRQLYQVPTPDYAECVQERLNAYADFMAWFLEQGGDVPLSPSNYDA